jgi:hypothetical protein
LFRITNIIAAHRQFDARIRHASLALSYSTYRIRLAVPAALVSGIRSWSPLIVVWIGLATPLRAQDVISFLNA